MTEIKYSLPDGTIIASGILGESVHKFEGSYYFDKDSVNFTPLDKQVGAYHCPIKNSDCDYYYLKDSEGKRIEGEIGWIYEAITNQLFVDLEGKMGMYDRNTPSLIQTKTSS